MQKIDIWQKRRKELHWTYDDLARESGVSRRTIAGIFGGDPRYESPTLNTMQAIERALGLSEWSAEEKALGVGDHEVKLSPEEWEWLELRSEIIRTHGKEYADTLTALIQKITENSDKK